MIITATAFALWALAATGPAQGGHYSVRNRTPRTFTCTLRPEHGRFFEWFVLRPGGEWSQSSRTSGPRRLSCDDQTPSTAFWMRANQDYELYERGRARVLSLRPAGQE
jgi:hypothetical protein